jgi:TPR repeat protein
MIVAQQAQASDDYEPVLLKTRTLRPENIPLLQERAKAGNSEAQLLIGLACAYRHGADRDAKAAVDWYRKACAAEDDETRRHQHDVRLWGRCNR